MTVEFTFKGLPIENETEIKCKMHVSEETLLGHKRVVKGESKSDPEGEKERGHDDFTEKKKFFCFLYNITLYSVSFGVPYLCTELIIVRLWEDWWWV